MKLFYVSNCRYITQFFSTLSLAFIYPKHVSIGATINGGHLLNSWTLSTEKVKENVSALWVEWANPVWVGS